MSRRKYPLPQIGDRFSRLTVIGEPFNVRVFLTARTKVPCRCDCGTTKDFEFDRLRNGNTTSCGCYRREWSRRIHTTHGESDALGRSPVYSVWVAMKARCSSDDPYKFEYYGSRGITVCDEWRNNYVVFRDWALASGYVKGLEIDRIDNNGNYEPSNCRFVTHKDNSRNRRSNHLLTAFGETKSMTEWSEDVRCQVDFGTLKTRINRRHWDSEIAITTPSKR